MFLLPELSLVIVVNENQQLKKYSTQPKFRLQVCQEELKVVPNREKTEGEV